MRASLGHPPHPVRLPPGGEERQRQELGQAQGQDPALRGEVQLLHQEGQRHHKVSQTFGLN